MLQVGANFCFCIIIFLVGKVSVVLVIFIAMLKGDISVDGEEIKWPWVDSANN